MLLLTSVIPTECAGCDYLKDRGCARHNGMEDRQWTRLGGCASRPKVVVEEKKKGFVDPLKASKKAAKGHR